MSVCTVANSIFVRPRGTLSFACVFALCKHTETIILQLRNWWAQLLLSGVVLFPVSRRKDVLVKHVSHMCKCLPVARTYGTHETYKQCALSQTRHRDQLAQNIAWTRKKGSIKDSVSLTVFPWSRAWHRLFLQASRDLRARDNAKAAQTHQDVKAHDLA